MTSHFTLWHLTWVTHIGLWNNFCLSWTSTRKKKKSLSPHFTEEIEVWSSVTHPSSPRKLWLFLTLTPFPDSKSELFLYTKNSLWEAAGRLGIRARGEGSTLTLDVAESRWEAVSLILPLAHLLPGAGLASSTFIPLAFSQWAQGAISDSFRLSIQGYLMSWNPPRSPTQLCFPVHDCVHLEDGGGRSTFPTCPEISSGLAMTLSLFPWPTTQLKISWK